MGGWVVRGIKTGIKTTRYPEEQESRAGVSPGLPVFGGEGERAVDVCPTQALSVIDGGVAVDYRRCIHCFRCVRTADAAPVAWQSGYEWAADAAAEAGPATTLDRKAFDHSLQVLVVDGGDCGACLSEVAQLNNPYYNMHRLGFFITPTPRIADVLLLVGPVTDQMRDAIKQAYDAMPTPKRVVAAGVCALSGGIFGPSFSVGSGAADVVPVDVLVPGCPPPPLAILHGLLVAVQRKPPAAITSPAGLAEQAEVAR